MMSTPEVEPSPQQPAYLDAPQPAAVIRPLPAEVAATDAANPYAMLPLCHTCGQRVPHGSATHNGERWHCMRCWGGWLAGVPEPKELRVNGSMIRFEPAPGPGALDWSDAD